MLAAYCKEPEDDHTGPHHVGVCVLNGDKNNSEVLINGRHGDLGHQLQTNQ